MTDDGAPAADVVQRIATRVRKRREELNRDQDLARYGGPTRATVGLLENQARWPLRARTRTSWATALGWEPDAFERLERGEEPVELENNHASAGEDRLRGLVSRLRELADEAEKMMGDK